MTIVLISDGISAVISQRLLCLVKKRFFFLFEDRDEISKLMLIIMLRLRAMIEKKNQDF